jgi:hypothetical protein
MSDGVSNSLVFKCLTPRTSREDAVHHFGSYFNLIHFKSRQTHNQVITTLHGAIMDSTQAQAEQTYDVLVLGAGLSGICSLYHIRERFPSWNIKALEAGDGVGGTWVS